jgi:SAM-dependent methyltransferase
VNALANDSKIRGRFHGVRQIIYFNWPRYVAAAAMLAGAYLAFWFISLPGWIKVGLICGGLLVVWWTIASLVASYWIYDVSGLMSWKWLKQEFPEPPRHWLNIHAGLDESTPELRRLWPDADGDTVDIFSSVDMTEGSIYRARGGSNEAVRHVNFRTLPFEANEFDTVFLLFAAHELRQPNARRALLAEVRRVVSAEGRMVLVEHLRNAPNFVAYGPGFLHFHSRRTWDGDLAAVGLSIKREFCQTGFVRVFIVQK